METDRDSDCAVALRGLPVKGYQAPVEKSSKRVEKCPALTFGGMGGRVERERERENVRPSLMHSVCCETSMQAVDAAHMHKVVNKC